MKGTIRRRILLLAGLCVLAAALITAGCSSGRVTDSSAPSLSPPDGSAAPKITIETDYSSPMPETNIIFDLPIYSHIFLEITNATGYSMKVLYDGMMEPGSHYVNWDGTNEDGERIGSGIYMAHLVTEFGTRWAPLVYWVAEWDDLEKEGAGI